MINTRDRRITHSSVANISVDQILDFIIICDLNLLKTLSPAPAPAFFFFFPRFLLLKRPTYYRNPPEY